MNTIKNTYMYETGIFTVHDLIKHYEANNGGLLFNVDAMKLLKVRVSSNLYYKPSEDLVMFITSEKHSYDLERKYMVRYYNTKTFKVGSWRSPQQYDLLVTAKTAARRYCNG